jgi:hypothetical protein
MLTRSLLSSLSIVLALPSVHLFLLIFQTILLNYFKMQNCQDYIPAEALFCLNFTGQKDALSQAFQTPYNITHRLKLLAGRRGKNCQNAHEFLQVGSL